MGFDFEKIPNKQKAVIYREDYGEWKEYSLDHHGYFPIFQTFKEAFLLRDLSGNALRLYLYLGLMSGNKTGETWVSIDTIAQYFDKSTRAISNWIKELEEAKLIERMQLENNGVSHTFLKPYGEQLFNNPNVLQKGRRK